MTQGLWFVLALLIFSTVCALWWGLDSPAAHKERREGSAPSNWAIAGFAMVVGLITFIVRIWLPVGWWFVPLNFQFPHFAQYTSLFLIGAVAYRRGWLSGIWEDAARGKLWGWVVALLIALAPLLFVAGGALKGSTAAFRGGLHWQSLTYALWEQFLCVGMIISLLVWFRRRRDRQGRLARAMSASAYAVYICHAPILVYVSFGLSSLELYPLFKFALASLISMPICFGVGGLVRKLPAAQRIL